MRRHRVYEHELPAVKVGLHGYQCDMCSYPTDTDENILNAFRLFYRVINYKAGQPNYPTVLDENGNIQYSVIRNHLLVAEKNDPDLMRMAPFLSENIIPPEITEILPAWPRAGLSPHLSSGQILKETT